jgi:hypothetical protein
MREMFNFSHKKFSQSKCSLEIVDLLNYIEDKKPKEIELLLQVAHLILGQDRH